MLCSVCRGSGNIISFPNGKPEWWDCVKCGGAGVTVLFSPPTIKLHKIQFDKWRKAAIKAAKKMEKANAS